MTEYPLGLAQRLIQIDGVKVFFCPNLPLFSEMIRF